MTLGSSKPVLVAAGSLSTGPSAPLSWRHAGAVRVWRKFAIANEATEWQQGIVEALDRDGALQGKCSVYVVSGSPSPLLGRITEDEMDALSGALPLAANGERLSIGIDCGGMRVLARLARDGILEAVLFAKMGGPMRRLAVPASPGRGSSEPTGFASFAETTGSAAEHGTRRADCARLKPWARLSGIGDQAAARAAFETFLVDEANQHFGNPLPFAALGRKEVDAAEIDWIKAFMRDLFLSSPALASAPMPLFSVKLPSSAGGIARIGFHPETLPGARAGELAAVVTGIAAAGMRSWSNPMNPDRCGVMHEIIGGTYGHVPGDNAMEEEIFCDTNASPGTAHERLAAKERIVTWWEEARSLPDFEWRLQAAAGLAASPRLVEEVTTWIAS